MELPKTMRAWQYGKVSGGLEKSLKLNPSVPVPTPKADQHLVKIHSVCLNPVDHKVAEVSLMRRFLIPDPATPGVDFSGTIVKPAQDSSLKPGDKVFGAGISAFAGGCLAEYALAPKDSTVALPKGVSMDDASTIPVAGLTAYQTIAPYVSQNGGTRLFFTGGSGGVGIFGIQIAKALGAQVTVTCSGRNEELCKSLGADQVVDYTKHKDLAAAVAATCKEGKYEHVVDNILSDPNLYWDAHKYSEPRARYIIVGGGTNARYIFTTLKIRLWPSLLGGGRRKAMGFFAQIESKGLEQIGRWMAEGKVKAIVDEKFRFEDVTKAFEKLKTQRAKGKIMVKVEEAS